MSIILQWLQLVLKLRQPRSSEDDQRHFLLVKRGRLSARDQANLFIAAHRRFIL